MYALVTEDTQKNFSSLATPYFESSAIRFLEWILSYSISYLNEIWVFTEFDNLYKWSRISVITRVKMSQSLLLSQIESIESKMSMMQIESKLGQIESKNKSSRNESKWILSYQNNSSQIETNWLLSQMKTNWVKLSQIDSFYKIKLSSLRSL